MNEFLKSTAEACEHVASTLKTAVKLTKLISELAVNEDETTVACFRHYEELVAYNKTIDTDSLVLLADDFEELAKRVSETTGVVFIGHEEEPVTESVEETFLRYGGTPEEEPETEENEEEEPEEEESDQQHLFDKIRETDEDRRQQHLEPAIGSLPKGYRAIDWYQKAGIPRDKYVITRGRLVVNRYRVDDEHPFGATIYPRRNHRSGKEVYELLGNERRGGKRKTPRVYVEPDELFARAFPEFAGTYISRRTGRIELEACTMPCKILDNLNPSVEPESVEPEEEPSTVSDTTVENAATESPAEVAEEWVDITWIDGISAGKYFINENGEVKRSKDGHVYSGFKVTKHDEIFMSMYLDTDDGKRISRRKAVLVWQAFHPETREMTRLRVYHQDHDKENCILANLYV